MEIIELKQFRQPTGDEVTLQVWDTTPFSPVPSYPFSCERLVNGWMQEAIRVCDREMARQRMNDWESFEKKIGSKER